MEMCCTRRWSVSSDKRVRNFPARSSRMTNHRSLMQMHYHIKFARRISISFMRLSPDSHQQQQQLPPLPDQHLFVQWIVSKRNIIEFLWMSREQHWFEHQSPRQAVSRVIAFLVHRPHFIERLQQNDYLAFVASLEQHLSFERHLQRWWWYHANERQFHVDSC